MDVVVCSDARQFLRRAHEFLDTEPLLTTVLGSVARRLADQQHHPPQLDYPPWWPVIEDRGTTNR